MTSAPEILPRRVRPVSESRRAENPNGSWWILFVYAFVGLISGSLFFLDEAGAPLIYPWGWRFGFALCALIGVRAWREGRLDSVLVVPRSAVIFGLVLFFVGDIFNRHFGFVVERYDRRDLIYLGIISSLPLLYTKTRRVFLAVFTSPWLVVLVSGAIALLELRYADGRLIFSDDHPSFLYRLQLLKEHFPHIPFYSTDWNGGHVVRELFSTGAFNMFVLAAPVLFTNMFGDILQPSGVGAYTAALVFVFVLVLPWCSFLAARKFHLSREGAVFGALLTLGPSLGYFEWLLRYGTLGFCVSVALFPLVFALTVKLFSKEERFSAAEFGLLLIAASLMSLWAPVGIAFVPLLIWGLAQLRGLSRGRKRLVFCFALCFFALNSIWIAPVFREINFGTLLSGTTLPGGHGPKATEVAAGKGASAPQVVTKLVRASKGVREQLLKVQPLVILCGIFAIAALRTRSVRVIFSITVVWCLVVTVVGDAFKPQLELRRMILFSAFLLASVAGEGTRRVIEETLDRIRESRGALGRLRGGMVLVLVLGFLFTAPVNVAATFLNRSDQQYVFAPKTLTLLADAIRAHGGTGRTFIFGFILHDLGAANYASQDGGHVAPLPILSGSEMYASHYYHTRWSTVDPIPALYRDRGEAGVEEFLDLVNATAVVTFNKSWAKYCASHARYSKVFQDGRFSLWTRESANAGYFLEGRGEVLKGSNAEIKIRAYSRELVLKYRYSPRLRIDSKIEAEISPKPVFLENVGGNREEEVAYIRIVLRDSPSAEGTELSLRYPGTPEISRAAQKE